jgi:transcriptional regulator with XRE-family HTH domain
LADTGIHFGAFVRAARKKERLSIAKFAVKIGLTEKRAWQIEQMAEPSVYDETLVNIASFMGLSPSQFEQTWRSTPVALPKASDADPFKKLEALAARLGLNVHDIAEHFANLAKIDHQRGDDVAAILAKAQDDKKPQSKPKRAG